MESNQTVVHTSAISVVRYARKNGITEEELSHILNRDLTQLNLSTLRLRPEELNRLIKLVKERTGDEFLGLHAAETLKIHDLGILGYVLMNCRDMEQVMEKVKTYYQLTGNVTRLSLAINGSEIKCHWEPIQKMPAETERVVMESLLAGASLHIAELTGFKPVMKWVQFSWSAPKDISEYVRLFGPDLSFDQPYTALSYADVNLEIPIKSSNSELLPVFESHARECYQRLSEDTPLSARTKEFLMVRIGNLPKLETVAAELNLSPRSFQLKLKEEGTTFLELRDMVRYETARKALDKGHLSAAQIGERLGFSEPSAFYRTFKRWSGRTPSQYRAENIA